MLRPCLACSTPAKGSYCPTHAPRKHDGRTTTERGLGHDYRKAAKRVLAEESVCWMDGEGPRPNDPLTVDHITPRSQGGGHERSNLRAAHASCNSRRGAKMVGTPAPSAPREERYAV